MIIDFHTHVFPPQIKQNRAKYVAADPCFAMLYAKKEAKLATADELIDSMDKEGVDVSVILNISWTTHELCVESNDYIMESVARYPKRLVGFGSIPPESSELAIAEIERCARGGLKGLGEIRRLDIGNSETMAPIAEVLKKHRLILLTHTSEPVGHSYPGKGAITPDVFYPFITSFPDVTLVCAHWGGGLPFYALMPEVQKAMGNVFFDTAASPYLYRPQVYRQVIELVGADKVLFGSDYPLLSPARLLKDIDSVNLPVEAKNQILAGNARRLLGI
ncbi:MAG: amidohydrolase family protein [Chloroflexota bacterium]|nr:amidohydrolase family protein [Chloroflexota bacterium]